MLWVMLVYHPYRFAGRVETAPEAVSVFVKDCPLTTNVYMDTFNLYHHALMATLLRWIRPAEAGQDSPFPSTHRVCHLKARLHTHMASVGSMNPK